MSYNRLSTYKTRVLDLGDGMLCVQYHRTIIVKTWPQHGRKVVLLDTGGWKGVTTKRKMNQASHQFALGYSVHQTDHVWYVTTKAGEYEFTGNTFALDAETGVPWDVVELFINKEEKQCA